MTVIERDENDAPKVWCDPCLATIVSAMNARGIRTLASCCGHGKNDPSIALADGRWLVITNAPPVAYVHRAPAKAPNAWKCPHCGERAFGIGHECPPAEHEICGAELNADSRPCQSERGHLGNHWTPSDQADKPAWWSTTDVEIRGDER